MITATNRQGFLGTNSSKLLKDSKVAIIGLCGGGSHISQQLVHLGVGHFVLCDPDWVEDSNLNRMVSAQYFDAQERHLKVDVICREILAVSPDTEVKKISQRWQDAAIELRDCTAIFGCVDSYQQRSQIEAFCRRFLIPYFDIGMDVSEVDGGYAISGQAILSMPGHPCMRCMGFITDSLLAAEAQKYGAAGGRPQVVWPNGALASSLVGMFVSTLLPWNNRQSTPLYMEYDGNSHSIFASNRLRVIGRHCPHFSGYNDVGDPFF